MKKIKKVVVIGGGTGTSVVLNGLKHYPQLDLTAVVAVSDSGGSTGRLKDEFGFLPVGDARQCLAALTADQAQQSIRDLLLYRFAKGNGLVGHNLGNLILTALEDLTHSPGLAIEVAANIFRIKGRVLPITEKSVELVINYADGSQLVGEHHLDDYQPDQPTIEQLSLSAPAQIYSPAAAAIRAADLIVFGPGDLFGSLLPHSLVTGFSQALKDNSGRFVYVMNLVTHFSQTRNLTASQHLAWVTKYCGRQPEVVVINDQPVPPDILAYYQQYQEQPIIDDLEKSLPNQKIIRAKLLDTSFHLTLTQDKTPRSVLRHDSAKLANLLAKLSDQP